jgi:hypothetical protein
MMADTSDETWSFLACGGTHRTWDVRRVMGGAFKAVHRSEHGCYAETVRPGDVVLVERLRPIGRDNIQRAIALTRLSSFLPPSFERCCVEVDEVDERTEVIGTYDVFHRRLTSAEVG